MMLDLYAGKSAYRLIQEQGISPDMFGSFWGASGGPKWFCLFELDKYIFGEFFTNRSTSLNLVGSSVGAFRSACLAQKDPVAAISRMAESYSETTFVAHATPQDVTEKAKEMLNYILGANGCGEIINNPIFKSHFLVNRAKGFAGSENKTLQVLGLMTSLCLNRIDRRLIRHQYERFVFKPSSSELKIDDYCGFNTHYINLTEQNLKQALLASGSIPLVMAGIKNIEGAPKGTYRDGGIIDYHFDIKLQHSFGLILYPHFNPKPKAGWFDKNLNRQVRKENYDNVLMLVPSEQFVNLLPFRKIPDRTDFDKLSNKERIEYWKKVLLETKRLSDEFDLFCSKPDLSKIKPL